jgi:hypothetical protein
MLDICLFVKLVHFSGIMNITSSFDEFVEQKENGQKSKLFSTMAAQI